MFLNLSNHNSKDWGEKQKKIAKKYGEIVDFQFPNIDPELNEDKVRQLAINTVKHVIALEPDIVMCQGEFTLTHLMVNMLLSKNIRVVVACSERKSVDHLNENGTVSKQAVFDFVRFRDYII